VAFPTETVYGLGCNALSPVAIQKVYAAKRRPATNPLIVHVLSSEDAHQLVDWSHASVAKSAASTFSKLTANFWPGPLTLILPSSDKIPPAITANTGNIALRSPRHVYARSLLAAAKVPIAAPSANLYGHVSPTSSQHVMSDLGQESIVVIDDDTVSKCDVGIESTVCSITDSGVVVLRSGVVTSQMLREALGGEVVVSVAETSGAERREGGGGEISPGMAMRHYSPSVPSKVLRKGAKLGGVGELETTVVIRYGGADEGGGEGGEVLRRCLAVMNLSPSGNSEEAAREIFKVLREAESVEGVERILLPDLEEEGGRDEVAAALRDRLMRAASGEYCGGD
jgi:tRNA threonylcarbamoyl adenosine modification protein (Sua5/YciO/YrdC/YwlC family)